MGKAQDESIERRSTESQMQRAEITTSSEEKQLLIL